jgi:hypothetical protein
MNATQFCQVGDEGVDLVITFTDLAGTALELREQDTYYVRLRYPDGTSVDFGAHLLNDGADGKVVYTTGVDDLDQAGQYVIQGKMIKDGYTKNTRRGSFEAFPNVDDGVEEVAP